MKVWKEAQSFDKQVKNLISKKAFYEQKQDQLLNDYMGRLSKATPNSKMLLKGDFLDQAVKWKGDKSNQLIDQLVKEWNLVV